MQRQAITIAAALFLATGAPVLAKPPSSVDALPIEYLEIDTMTAPVVDDYRLLGALQVRLVLRVEHGAVRAKLASEKPKVVDVFTRTLAEFSRIRVDTSRPVDVDRLAATLQGAVDGLAPKGAAQVLILEAVVRRT